MSVALTALEDKDLPAVAVAREVLVVYEGDASSRSKTQLVKIRPGLVKLLPGRAHTCVI